jgi:ACS family pantothenate transporter-like MFS transporter
VATLAKPLWVSGMPSKSELSGYQIFWLKAAGKPGTIATKYTVEQINLYPLVRCLNCHVTIWRLQGQQAIQVVFTFVYAFWSDAVRKRWPPIVFGGVSRLTGCKMHCWRLQLLSFVVCTILAATPVWTNIPRRWAMYYLSTAFGGISGLIMGWASELLTESSEARAITIGSMNM